MALKQKELAFDFFKIENLKKKAKMSWLKKLGIGLFFTFTISLAFLSEFCTFVVDNTNNVIYFNQKMGKAQMEIVSNEITNLKYLLKQKEKSHSKISDGIYELGVDKSVEKILNQSPSLELLNETMLILDNSSVSNITKNKIAYKIQNDIKILYQKMDASLEANLKKHNAYNIINVLTLEEYKSIALYDLTKEYGKFWLKSQEQLKGEKIYKTQEQLNNAYKNEMNLIWEKEFKQSDFYNITKYE